MSRRRGVTGVELLIGLVLLSLLVLVGVPLVRAAATGSVQAAQQVARERDATAFAMLLDRDLRHGVRADVVVPGPAALSFDRPVGEAEVCDIAAGAPLVRAGSWRGSRAAAAGRDEMLVLVVVEPATWQRRVIAAVAGTSCPDGAAALRLDPDLPLVSAAWVRVVEPVRLRRYASGGLEWLGLEHRWNGTVVQPFAGPVDPATTQWLLLADALRAVIGPNAGITAALHLPLE